MGSDNDMDREVSIRYEAAIEFIVCNTHDTGTDWMFHSSESAPQSVALVAHMFNVWNETVIADCKKMYESENE